MTNKILALVAALSGGGLAPAALSETPLLLWSAYLQARETGDRARAEIARLDAEIAKNEASIVRSQKIVELAQQRGNMEARQAEVVARQALEKAAAARRANELARIRWALARAQAETTGASIRGLLDRGGAGAVAGVRGLLTQRSGKVRITKADGREVAFTDGILEKGDRLLVEEGHARVTMLDGRCVAVVGPGSEIALTEDNAEKQTMEQTGGKVEVEVERAEDFTERMTKSIARFWDDLGAIAGADRSDIEAALKFGRRRLEARFRAANKVTAVLGVRGTHYECEARRDGGLEVTVYEGVVDVTILETGQFLALASGEKGIVAPGGALRKENFPLPPAGERETEIPAL